MVLIVVNIVNGYAASYGELIYVCTHNLYNIQNDTANNPFKDSLHIMGMF